MNKITFPLRPQMQGATVADLQDALKVCLDRSALLASDEGARRELSAALIPERDAQSYGRTTTRLVGAFQRERRLEGRGEVDEATANALNSLLTEWGLLDQPPEPVPAGYQVEGVVFNPVSAGVSGLRVVIVDKGVGDDDGVELVRTTTDNRGAYQATFSDSDVRRRGKTQPDLQARVFTNETFLGASDVHYNASPKESLNVLLEDNVASTLKSEHDVLTNVLASEFKGRLGDLKETDKRQDITYLANKTGWDARAVAMAALADQFSTNTVDASGSPAIAPAFFYALFRAGLPTNEDMLYHADAKTVEGVWKKAAEQGVISKESVDQIPRATEAFQALSVKKLLTGPALIGVSSFKEMLDVSRLNDAQRTKFVELYAANRTDMPAFWKAVADAFGQDRADRLQLDGKLGFLTINNATLMQKMHTIVGRRGLSDPLQLAEMGYHRAEPWTELLTPDVPIPEEIPGDTAKTKRTNYARYLAAQVRLSYPTAAVAQMIKSGELPLTDAPEGVSEKVHAFLTEHQGKFEIGVQPVRQYIADNKLQVTDDVVQQLTRLQRVYQITPSDEALIGLMKRRVDAAFHVARHDRDTFVQSFAPDVGGADQAALIYDRSVQIHGAVLNIALSYLYARTAPAIGVHSPGGTLDPAPAYASDIIAYATLERLFGSMDFCTCEHCRSILSPAAYLVDLLLFLDQPSPPAGTENPQTVLLERRPDIQHLPLTCENTNTALPYIDLVNETLEYYIANDKQKLSLTDYHGHDSNTAASEDLSASPQFVMDSAYATLAKEYFPAPLPFHQPLESLRRYFNKFEVPLPLAMERLRKSDDLERGGNLYGWRDILMEELGLSRKEYDILTTSDVNEDDELKEIFGFVPTETSPIDKLSNAKKFCRRIGISYEDLVSILKARFINPNSDLIPKLEQLHVSFATLKALKDGTIKDSDFDNLLAVLAVLPDPAAYGGDPNAPKSDYTPIRAWVKDDENYDRIMGLITLKVAVTTWTANTAYAAGDCVVPTKPQPGPTPYYYECTTEGKSANKEPTWPSGAGETCKDGTVNTVEWTCRDPSSCHSFDNMAFRYSDPAKFNQDISAVEFVRLLRFVRLWKKLGWSIEQTDAAICALYRGDLGSIGASDINDFANLNTGFLTLLPRLGIVMRVMKALNLTVKRDLLSLLACWSDIGTHGDNSLYRQMFLNPAILEQDAVFKDNGYGEFLTDDSQTLLATNSTKKAKLAGKVTSKDVLSTSINGLVIDYTVVAGDTSIPTLAAHIVSTINATTTADPITGKPLNDVIVASSASDIITVTMKNPKPDSSITLVCSVSDGATETYAPLDHESALCAAFNLTGSEFTLITDALKFDATTQLSLANISAIFRRGWLARKLKISVRELLLLTELTGFDPFAAPDPTNPAILRLISLVQAMKDTSLKSAVALYLIWNQDLSGKSAPDPAQVAELARTLRGDFASIDDQFTAMEDPNGDLARARMSLVYGQETSDAFFALLDDTLVVDVAYTHSASGLEPAITKKDPRIAYDAFRHRLSHRGLMTTTMQNKLKNLGGDNFQKGVSALLDRSEDAKGSFFARNPELQPTYDTVLALEKTLVLSVDYTHPAATLEAAIIAADENIQYDNANHRLSYSGVLTAARWDILKSVPGVTLEFQSAVDALFTLSQASRGAVVLATLDPELSRRRKCQQALQRLSAAAGVDLVFTQTILDPASEPYPLHAAGGENTPALDDVIGLETSGLAAQFFDPTTGAIIPIPDQDKIVSKIDYAPLANGGGNPLPANPTPGAAISGTWSGQIETPEAGFYNFVIEADSDAKVTLTLDGEMYTVQNSKLVQNGNIVRNAKTIELKAATLYAIELKVEKVKDALSFKWETPKRAREIIPSRYLYPPTILEPFSSVYTHFLKAASLAMGLTLTAKEMWYFATHADYRINTQGLIDSSGQPWLNALPNADNLHLTDAAAITVAKNLNAVLLTPLLALLDFARIKTEISTSDESFLSALKDPVAATQKKDSLLFTITRWNQTALNDLLGQFGHNVGGLGHFDLFCRVYDAFALIQKMGISAKALIEATTNEPAAETVRNLKSALRARYDDASWRDVVRPINDDMRGLQRDALVAYILHQMRSHPESKHIDTPDKLFEYFLMDVEMDACMQTSRIRHALSSVQLFIERCLMNLEPRVSTEAFSDDKRKQWEWMKRYRVWEANRKVYLFPENWLEPELRDDQSPFFKETMSELLQGDITEDRAAVALLNYLTKLAEVAKLKPCGMFHIPAGDRTPEINHVVARTEGGKYYCYRRYEGGSWTPWEQIKLDIEDNPVIPVVWNDRLFLFWLRVLKEPEVTVPTAPAKTTLKNVLASAVITGKKPEIKVSAVLCWSEYYNGKWQPTKTSNIDRPIKVWGPKPPEEFDRALWRLWATESDDTLIVGVEDTPNAYLSSYRIYNSHSLPLVNEDLDTNLFFASSAERPVRQLDGHYGQKNQSLHVVYFAEIKKLAPYGALPLMTFDILLNNTTGYVIEPTGPRNPWTDPFSYSDSRHVFYVTTYHEPVRVNKWVDFGVDRTPQRRSHIGPLQVRWTGPFPQSAEQLLASSIELNTLTRSPYITKAIGSIGTVNYEGVEIGVQGALNEEKLKPAWNGG